ncbi:MAG: hypothetical protein ABL876_16445, partial [Chitinophagaceae bacterium]
PEYSFLGPPKMALRPAGFSEKRGGEVPVDSIRSGYRSCVFMEDGLFSGTTVIDTCILNS